MPGDLEAVLGDARDGGNPIGYAEIVRADERGELLAAGEDALTGWGCNAEFVPAHLGGRLRTADELVRRVRPVFRRDVALGLGYGVTSLMAAVNVWSAGTADQQRRVSELLLRGERLAVAYHELAHGNDFGRNEFEARWDGDRVRLSGTKEVINNIARAAAFVLFARTEEGGGPSAHSLFLIEKDTAAGLTYLPRTRTSGVRGVRLGGLLARGQSTPASALLGARGQGVAVALRSFQVTRAVLPGLAVGAVDTALRTVVRFAASRRLYGATVLDLPHAQETLAGAFADLLVADALAMAACRGLHLLPEQASLHAAATKYLVARLLTDAMDDLAVILGARYYLREGPTSIFGKHLRDLPVISLGHAGETACLLAIIAHLPMLARHAWRDPVAAPPAVFDTAAPLPELAFARLALSTGGRDDITGLLLAAPDTSSAAASGAVGALVTRLGERLRALAQRASAIAPLHRGPLAPSETFALAEQYAVLLGATAAVGAWRAGHDRGDAFLGDPRWLAAALARLDARLTHRPAPLPDGTADWLLRELIRRERDGESFDLSRTPVLT